MNNLNKSIVFIMAPRYWTVKKDFLIMRARIL